MTCGYSPLMIFAAVCVSVLMIGFGLAVGYGRRIKGGMPLVGSCSAGISAACHTGLKGGYEVGAAEKAVQWGVVGGAEGVRMWGFESREVGEAGGMGEDEDDKGKWKSGDESDGV